MSFNDIFENYSVFFSSRNIIQIKTDKTQKKPNKSSKRYQKHTQVRKHDNYFIGKALAIMFL